jgi:hypothetical protein
VERSSDQKTWDEIGFVNSTGAGQLTAEYSYGDNNPLSGVSYYRISEVDLDGSIKYSDIRSIDMGQHGNSALNMWPNPARSSITIQNSGTDNNLQMQIYDPFGKTIATNVLHTGKNEVNLSSLPAGTYIVHTQMANGDVQNQKIVKL